MGKKWSKTVKGQVIAGIFVVVATIIGAVFLYLKPSSTSTTVKTGDQHNDTLFVAGDIINSTVNLNIFPSETEKTIEAPEDLDQHTSGIEKLPDGRARIGNFITGSPTFVLDEHNAADISRREKDFAKAFEHSKRAIQAYEESEQEVMKMKARITVGGNLNKSAVAKIYYLGALIAHQLKKNEQAYQWAEEANSIESNSKRVAFLAVTLFNLKRKTDALQIIDKGLIQDPNNPGLINVKNEISKHAGSQ